MLDLYDAINQLLAAAQPVQDTEQVDLKSAAGRICAVDIHSPVNVPAFDQSAMDGYALSTLAPGDTLLPLHGRIAAGQSGSQLPPDSAARIFTGAPVPEGTLAVVMQEDTESHSDGVRVLKSPRPGQHIRRKGEDIASGSTILSRGTRLTAAHIGLLASVGIPQISVFRKLKVALLSTGDELVEPGEATHEASVFNTNRYSLHALLTQMGVEVSDLDNIPDNADATRAALSAAASAYDLIISSGGVSVGEEDHVKAAIDALGELHLWKIAMKPGKPLAFGRVAATPFIGLPGNPVSAFVTCLLCAAPYIRLYQGQSHAQPQPLKVIADFDWLKADKRREFLRAQLALDDSGHVQARIHGNQGSAAMVALAWGDGLIEVPPSTPIRRGENVTFWSTQSLLNGGTRI
ncbi:molybdopterin molybdotransferase MoeA [Burkholderiaceae bacterium DAT-1]|nr:molybdopterin molybdotransferase MoeA [Burkholderiaceae bacterium DAT-1]